MTHWSPVYVLCYYFGFSDTKTEVYMAEATAKVAIVMGSRSDWPTMQKTAIMLRDLGVEFDASVVSAHKRQNS